mmetsp:Transcript_26532/g.55572  ORF Transcript_26532/g.55572 Transcript_26532/m.55572 type:complete len:476 (-) Transcript_26532:6-1433(-)
MAFLLRHLVWIFVGCPWMSLASAASRPIHEVPVLQRLLSQAKDLFPDGSLWQHVQYLSGNTSNPEELSLDVASILQNASLSPRQLRQESKLKKNLRLALCGLNGVQAVVTPGQIAANLNNVAQACQPPYPNTSSQQDFCAAMVSLDLALWGFFSIYIEGSVLSCRPKFSINAACALDITGLLASAAVTASAGANIRRNCPPPGGYKSDAALFSSNDLTRLLEDPLQPFQPSTAGVAREVLRERARQVIEADQRLQAKFSSGQGIRRLKDLAKLPPSPAVSRGLNLADDLERLEKGAKEALEKVARPQRLRQPNEDGAAEREAPPQERSILDAQTLQQHQEEETERNWKYAACFFDMSKAAARIAEVAVLAATAAEDCDPHNLAESGESGKNQCIIDITGALSSASIASTLISLNVINCPGTLQFSDALQQRLCAASILNIVTVSSYMTTSFATLGNICGTMSTQLEKRTTSGAKP